MTTALNFVKTVAPNSEYITLVSAKGVRSFYRADGAVMAAWISHNRRHGAELCLLAFDEPIDAPFRPEDASGGLASYVAVNAPLDAANLAAVNRFNASMALLPPPSLRMGSPEAQTLAWRLAAPEPIPLLKAIALRFAEVFGRSASPAWTVPVRGAGGFDLIYWAPGLAYELGRMRIRETGGAPIAPVNPAPAERAPVLPTAETPQAAGDFYDASTLTPRPLSWQWEGKILRGKINLLAGEGGVGKSTISRSITAIVTNGGVWPTGERCEPGCVIFLECEDPLREVTLPDLIAAGANMARIRVGDTPIDLSTDLRPLTAMVDDVQRATGVRVSLIVLSPIRSFFTGKTGRESFNNTEVRARLKPLEQYAEANGIAILGVHHPKEGSDSFAGSKAWVEVARSGLFAKWSDGVGSPRFVYPLKSNSGRVGWRLAYDTEGATVHGCPAKVVVWGEQTDGEANGAAKSSRRRG